MEATTVIWAALAGGALGLLAAAAGGGSLLAVLSELAGWRRRFPFLRNFGQQSVRLALYGLAPWLCLLAAAGLLIQYLPGWTWLLPRILGMPELLALGLVFLAGGALTAAYAGTWKAMKKHPLSHCLIGLSGALCLNAGFALALNTVLHGIRLEPGAAAGSPAFLSVWVPPAAGEFLWPAIAQALPHVLGGAGVLAMLVMLLRRNRDDFGRDYYRFALPRAAQWSLLFVLQGAGPIVAFHLNRPPAHAVGGLFMAFAAGAAVFLIGSAFLSLAVMRSSTPLRLKGTIVATCLTAWLGASSVLACQIWLWIPLEV